MFRPLEKPRERWRSALSGGRHDNRMRVASSSVQPAMFAMRTSLFQRLWARVEFAPGRWTFRPTDDTADVLPVAISALNKMRVDISIGYPGNVNFLRFG